MIYLSGADSLVFQGEEDSTGDEVACDVCQSIEGLGFGLNFLEAADVK